MAQDDKDIGVFTLKNLRLSYPHLYKPQTMTDKKTGNTSVSFNGNVLIPKDTPEGDAARALFEKKRREVMTAKLGAETEDKKWPKLKPEKICLRDGDLEEGKEYQDHDYISFRSKDTEPPLLLLKTKHTDGIDWDVSTKESEIYGGCFVNIKLQLWYMDHEDYGKRLNCTVLAVQFNKKGEAFSGKPTVTRSNSFTDIEADDTGMGDEDDYGYEAKPSSSTKSSSGGGGINYDDL